MAILTPLAAANLMVITPYVLMAEQKSKKYAQTNSIASRLASNERTTTHLCIIPLAAKTELTSSNVVISLTNYMVIMKLRWSQLLYYGLSE